MWQLIHLTLLSSLSKNYGTSRELNTEQCWRLTQFKVATLRPGYGNSKKYFFFLFLFYLSHCYLSSMQMYSFVCVVFVYSVKVSAESVSKLHSQSQRLPLILARVVRQMIPVYHTPCSYLYVAIAIWPVAAPLKLSRSSLSAVEALPPVTSLFAQQDAIHNVPFGQQMTQRERKLSLRVVKRK